MPDFFLQIIVPTYNRFSILNETLHRFVDALKDFKLKDIVRIIILDNNSSDLSREVVNLHSSNLPILFIQNPLNIGPERNIYKSICLPGAKWTWIFGDDDIIMPHTIETLFDFLNRLPENNDLVLFNYAQMSSDLRQLLSSKVCEVPDYWQGYWNGNNGLVDHLGVFDLLGFISSVVIKTERSVYAPDFTYFGSLYDHTSTILSITKTSLISVLPPGLMFQRQMNQRPIETIETGNGKLKHHAFILQVMLFHEALRINPELGDDFFDKLTSKIGINEPVGPQSYINTYIWLYERYAKSSIQITKDPHEKNRIIQSIQNVIPLIKSEQARHHISNSLLSLK